MDLSRLAAANELSGRINKLEKLLSSLEPGRINVILSPNKSNSPISTIGTGESCEHDLAPLATGFLSTVREHYQHQLATLHAQFSEL